MNVIWLVLTLAAAFMYQTKREREYFISRLRCSTYTKSAFKGVVLGGVCLATTLVQATPYFAAAFTLVALARVAYRFGRQR